MPIGKLIWSTPTGSVLWELWARQRRLFIGQAGILCLAAIAAPWLRFVPKGYHDLAAALAMQGGSFSILQTVTCFCYMEIDVRRIQGGIPGYLFLKPMSTTRLVLTPMLAGGLLVAAVFLGWAELVWRHVNFPMEYVPWSCLALFSFTCSVQGICWSLVKLSWVGQAVFVLLAAVANLVPVLAPKLPVELSTGRRLGIFAALLTVSVPLALLGVQRVRQGAGETVRFTGIRRKARARKKRFTSAFQGQFWLEWRRQGLRLPAFTLIGLALIMLSDFLLRLYFKRMVSDPGSPVEPYSMFQVLNYLALTPLVCSLVLGGGLLAKFDPAQPGNELPTYMTIRPLTNGDFVRAKVVTAAVSSLLNWIVAGAMILLWLFLGGNLKPTDFWHFVQAKPIVFAGLFGFTFFLLVFLTWRNLIAGIGIGLTGRPGLIAWHNAFKGIVYTAVLVIGFRAGIEPDFRRHVFHWLPATLVISLAAKLMISCTTLRWALRRKAVTWRAIHWLSGAWLAGGLIIALISRRVCLDLHVTEHWPWVVLAGFLLFPLAELALAPAALALNRHR